MGNYNIKCGDKENSDQLKKKAFLHSKVKSFIHLDEQWVPGAAAGHGWANLCALSQQLYSTADHLKNVYKTCFIIK